MKPPYFREREAKVTELPILTAKVIKQATFPPGPRFWSKRGVKVTKSDGIPGKVLLFWTPFVRNVRFRSACSGVLAQQ